MVPGKLHVGKNVEAGCCGILNDSRSCQIQSSLMSQLLMGVCVCRNEFPCVMEMAAVHTEFEASDGWSNELLK